MSGLSFLNPADPPERRLEKLERIVDVLMRRVERDTDQSNPNYSHFQAAIVLEKQVKSRTKDLGEALELLERTNAQLSVAKAEAEAARSDLANALEAIQEGFALFDPEDRLVMRNSRFCSYLPDVVALLEPGVSFADYVRIVSDSAHIKLEADQLREDWIGRRMAAHQRRNSTFNVEHKGDRWIQVSEQRTPNGGTAVLQTDVTDMLRIERQERNKLLGTQAEMIRATLDHLNQGIAIFDSGHFLLGSNERMRDMFGPPQRLLQTGTSFSSIVDFFLSKGTFIEAPELARLGRWVRQEETRAPLALRLTAADDRHFDVFCQETPDRGFVISFTDVTAERNAINAVYAMNETLEQRVNERTAELSDARDLAERANVSKSRFVAAVSHDLLQPLNAAKLFIASLNETEQPPQARELTQRINNAFGSVETILGALLDITKLDSGALSVDQTTIPLGALLASVHDQFRHGAGSKGLRLTVRPTNVVVRSDQTYLLRIVQNLVANAIRYTRTGGVLVGARRRGADVQIEVWDTGIGISEENRADIFKEFKRLHGQGRSEPGMGLGLAIVERACNLLEHELSFSSEPGRGSVFRVRVPLAISTTETRDAREAASDKALTPMVSLVIENQETPSAGLSPLLEDWGLNTIDASDGEQARQWLAEVGIVPDVIIVDQFAADGTDGAEIVRDLRRNFGPIPAVLMISDSREKPHEAALNDGIILLKKPIEPRHLRSILGWLQTTSDPGGNTAPVADAYA